MRLPPIQRTIPEWNSEGIRGWRKEENPERQKDNIRVTEKSLCLGEHRSLKNWTERRSNTLGVTEGYPEAPDQVGESEDWDKSNTTDQGTLRYPIRLNNYHRVQQQKSWRLTCKEEVATPTD